MYAHPLLCFLILNVMSSFKTVWIYSEDVFIWKALWGKRILQCVLENENLMTKTGWAVQNFSVSVHLKIDAIFSFSAIWLCEKEKVWASPSRSTWPSMSARAPYAPFVRSPPTSLASRPPPPSLSHFHPIRWQLPQRSALAAQVKPEGLEEEGEEEEGAAACCRRSYLELQGEGAPCLPWVAWTPPSRSTAVTAMITVSHLKVSPKRPKPRAFKLSQHTFGLLWAVSLLEMLKQLCTETPSWPGLACERFALSKHIVNMHQSKNMFWNIMH